MKTKLIAVMPEGLVDRILREHEGIEDDPFRMRSVTLALSREILLTSPGERAAAIVALLVGTRDRAFRFAACLAKNLRTHDEFQYLVDPVRAVLMILYVLQTRRWNPVVYMMDSEDRPLCIFYPFGREAEARFVYLVLEPIPGTDTRVFCDWRLYSAIPASVYDLLCMSGEDGTVECSVHKDIAAANRVWSACRPGMMYAFTCVVVALEDAPRLLAFEMLWVILERLEFPQGSITAVLNMLRPYLDDKDFFERALGEYRWRPTSAGDPGGNLRAITAPTASSTRTTSSQSSRPKVKMRKRSNGSSQSSNHLK